MHLNATYKNFWNRKQNKVCATLDSELYRRKPVLTYTISGNVVGGFGEFGEPQQPSDNDDDNDEEEDEEEEEEEEEDDDDDDDDDKMKPQESGRDGISLPGIVAHNLTE